MPLKLITGPVTEPLTLEEAKVHLRVDGSDDDAYIGALIIAAREVVEGATSRQLLPATWELALDDFEASITLDKAPFKEMVSVKHIDADGTEQTIAAEGYTLDDYSNPAKLVVTDLPTVKDTPNAVKIRFIAGSESVPEAIKAAMKLIIGNLYENRQEVVTGTIATQLPVGVDFLLNPYRVF